MYEFWYDYIKKKYGKKAQLQMTDTDSLRFHCKTDDIYEDMMLSMDLFDTSDYPENHALRSTHNKKALGKMKDEVNGQTEKRAKGVSKVTVKKDLKHEHYKLVLFEEMNKVSSMTSLRSHRHELFCKNIYKTGLCAFDDKRYLLNSVESYAYSHYKINAENQGYGSTCQMNEESLQMNDETSIQMDESPLDQLMDSPSVEVSSIHIKERVYPALLFENQSFNLNGFTITPCKIDDEENRNHPSFNQTNEESSLHMNEEPFTNETPLDQLMDSSSVEVSSIRSNGTLIDQMIIKPLVFESREFSPIEDQSFILDNFKITSCE